MTLLLAGSASDPLVVVRSHFWGFNGIAVFDGDEAAVIDPGIEPAEIAALEEGVTTVARGSREPRRVTDVVITHSHHDHIRGWMRFPGAEVHFPAVAATKGEGPRSRILAAKNAIDERLGIDDPGFRYPEPTHTFEEHATVNVGELELELLFLPGHSDCTSVVWIPELATLCTADYLVTPGLPYCRWRAREFEEAIATMERWVDEKGIERVVPAHNAIHEGRDAILDALREERDYFVALRAEVRAGLAEGFTGERCARRAARAMKGRRGADLGRRSAQDVDNAARVIAEESA